MSRRYDWRRIITNARSQPGVMQLAVTDVPQRTVQTVNERRIEDLEIEDGVLRAELRNQYRAETGHIRGDMFVVFYPEEKLT